MKLHRLDHDFPLLLKPYAINFAYKPYMYNYTCSFLSEVLQSDELCIMLYDFLKNIPGQEKTFNFPLRKNIICQDILNPHTIPQITLCLDESANSWDIINRVPISHYTRQNMNFEKEKILNPTDYTLIQDDKFLLAIRNLANCVELYIYKK